MEDIKKNNMGQGLKLEAEKEKPTEDIKQGTSTEEKTGTQQEEKQNKMPLTIFLFLLITAIIKDLIQIIFGALALFFPILAPIIIVLCFIICLPFSAFMFVITLLSGIRATWLFAGIVVDQLLPGLPGATITVILSYMFDKAPAPIKKTVEKASKLTSLTPLKTKT